MADASGRPPCPDRLLDDCGGAFIMGCMGGSAWHGVIGARNAPRGLLSRLRGFVDGVRTRAPTLGGNFAIWGVAFASFDCGFNGLRGKDDWINAVAAGAATGFVLAIRGGVRPALHSAVVGGGMLAIIEGVIYLMSSKHPAGAHATRDPIRDLLDKETGFNASIMRTLSQASFVVEAKNEEMQRRLYHKVQRKENPFYDKSPQSSRNRLDDAERFQTF